MNRQRGETRMEKYGYWSHKDNCWDMKTVVTTEKVEKIQYNE